MINLAIRHSLARWVVFVGLGLAAALIVTRPDDHWRLEMARATDASGLYLLLLLPLWSGVAAWEAQQARSRLTSALPSLQRHGRAIAFAASGVAVWAVALHTIVLLTLWAVAIASGALGAPLVLLPIVQFSIIVGFIAAGATLGWGIPSPLIGPAVAGGLLLANVLATSVTHIRQLTGLGEGGFDFNGQVPGRSGLLLQGACGALLAVATAVGTLRPQRWTRWIRALAKGAAAATAWLVMFWVTPTTTVTASAGNTTCVSHVVLICVPRQYGEFLPDIEAAVTSVRTTVDIMGGTSPHQFLFDSAGNSFPPGTGILSLTPWSVRHVERIDEAAIAAQSHPFSCDLVNAPSPLQFAIYDAVSQLIHERRGTRADTGLPGDLASAISSLPEAERRAWFHATTRSMWACQLKDLALPHGVGQPSWIGPDETP